MVIIAIAAGWLLASVGLALLIAPLISGARRLGNHVEKKLPRQSRGRVGVRWSTAPVHSGEPPGRRPASAKL